MPGYPNLFNPPPLSFNPGRPKAAFMIAGSSGRIATGTAHDHGAGRAPGAAGGSFGIYAERAGGQPWSRPPARYGGGCYLLYEPKSYSSSGTASPEPWPKA